MKKFVRFSYITKIEPNDFEMVVTVLFGLFANQYRGLICSRETTYYK
jgi:hypothetical protein